MTLSDKLSSVEWEPSARRKPLQANLLSRFICPNFHRMFASAMQPIDCGLCTLPVNFKFRRSEATIHLFAARSTKANRAEAITHN